MVVWRAPQRPLSEVTATYNSFSAPLVESAPMAWAPSPKARAGPIVFEALANLAEEIIFIVLVIFSILRIDLRRMPNSLSLPDEFRTCVIVWREAGILLDNRNRTQKWDESPC